MTFKISFKSAAVALIGSVSLASAAPVQAASVNFSDPAWQDFGNVVTNNNQAVITADMPENGISALLLDVNAGDALSFDWTFSPAATNPANALTFFNGNFALLSSAAPFGSFSQTFSTAGIFGVGFYQQPSRPSDSILSLNNAQFKSVPTPALLPGLIGLGLTAMRQRKRQAA